MRPRMSETHRPAREPLGQLSAFHATFKFRGRVNSVAFRKCFQVNRAARLAWPRKHLRSLSKDEHGGIDPSGKHVVREVHKGMGVSSARNKSPQGGEFWPAVPAG